MRGGEILAVDTNDEEKEEACGVIKARELFIEEIDYSSKFINNMKKEDVRILIAEDDFIINMYIEDIIVKNGFNVVGVVSTGEEVLELVNELKPNLILLDIGLAGKIDGIDVAIEIKKSHDVSVVFLTGNSDRINKDKRMEVADPITSIVKPIVDVDLIKILKGVIEKV